MNWTTLLVVGAGAYAAFKFLPNEWLAAGAVGLIAAVVA